jgi:CubicO group peptidase (beta-lactamase class C family)
MVSTRLRLHRGPVGSLHVVLLIATCLLLGSLAAADSSLVEATPESVGFSSERLVQLDEYMRDHVATGRVPGAVTLLARHGKVVAFKTYGKADADRNLSMKKDTIFRIYSQTKVVTGVAMMILFEEGKWHFDDPITRFVPEFKQLRVFTARRSSGPTPRRISCRRRTRTTRSIASPSCR